MPILPKFRISLTHKLFKVDFLGVDLALLSLNNHRLRACLLAQEVRHIQTTEVALAAIHDLKIHHPEKYSSNLIEVKQKCATESSLLWLTQSPGTDPGQLQLLPG
jgi:hypothetical protein